MDVMGILAGYMVFVLIIVAFAIIVQWKIFTKAGQPGWAVLVPFYNLYVYTQVLQRPKWWMALYFMSIIPLIGSIGLLVVLILDAIQLSKVFGKGGGFAVGLIFLGIIFQAILAFGDAEYQSIDGSESNDSSDLLDS